MKKSISILGFGVLFLTGSCRSENMDAFQNPNETTDAIVLKKKMTNETAKAGDSVYTSAFSETEDTGEPKEEPKKDRQHWRKKE
ncbi:hypothetical protein [Chryseobacterium sp.]|uniref:hypothetical protein n=1 Tax=Chryseobacterium sp. TaxID=1871047 RepID=UPI0011C8B6F4|nr:hypothetical protein [Chryseobacterium sp.]TXF77798.1 hypothetical protein FUA25_07705 [Chryseobacterium sp.]